VKKLKAIATITIIFIAFVNTNAQEYSAISEDGKVSVTYTIPVNNATFIPDLLVGVIPLNLSENKSKSTLFLHKKLNEKFYFNGVGSIQIVNDISQSVFSDLGEFKKNKKAYSLDLLVSYPLKDKVKPQKERITVKTEDGGNTRYVLPIEDAKRGYATSFRCGLGILNTNGVESSYYGFKDKISGDTIPNLYYNVTPIYLTGGIIRINRYYLEVNTKEYGTKRMMRFNELAINFNLAPLMNSKDFYSKSGTAYNIVNLEDDYNNFRLIPLGINAYLRRTHMFSPKIQMILHLEGGMHPYPTG
jgi:hypothetical protein